MAKKRKDDPDAAALHDRQVAAHVHAEKVAKGLSPYQVEVDEADTTACPTCGGSEWLEKLDGPEAGSVVACPRCLPQTAIGQVLGRYRPKLVGRVERPATEPDQLTAF